MHKLNTYLADREKAKTCSHKIYEIGNKFNPDKFTIHTQIHTKLCLIEILGFVLSFLNRYLFMLVIKNHETIK